MSGAASPLPPVVDQDGKLVGILSERDVMSIMMCPKWWATKIKDVMKRNVVCYEETTPVSAIYDFLCRVSLRGVIVVTEGRPTGMISRGSLLRWFTNLLAVSPGSMLDDSVLEGPSDEDRPRSLDPREPIRMIAHALVSEVAELQHHTERVNSDLVPAVVGGVSRIEELLNDLLAFSRHASSAELSEANDVKRLSAQATGTLSDLLGATQNEVDDASHSLSSTWIQSDTQAETFGQDR